MSYALYVGRNLTEDGIPYLAGYGDEPSSHWLEIVPRKQHAADATIRVGVTPQADMPGVLTDIPQASETARHIRVSYSYYLGVPAPLTNGGLNEHGVAVRDVWSTSRQELIDMTPKDQSGPNYSDLARIVVERARSAREGVEIIGELIARHGYSTYGGNSHLIADPDEAWVAIEFAGGLGLWAAERLGPDSIRVSRPGYIGEIPVDQPDHSDFLYPDHFVATAIEHGWYDPAGGEPFNVNLVFGDGKMRWEGVAWMEDEMRKRTSDGRKIAIEDVMWAIRTPVLTGDTAGYGQVVPLVHPEDPALRMLWHSQVGPIAAPFSPVYLGVRTVPEEYRCHRYLTTGEDSRFMDMRKADRDEDAISTVPQGIESTRSAAQAFKRLLYLVLQHEERFLPEITEVWEARESALLKQQDSVRRTAETLIAAGEGDLAADYLTYYCSTELMAALNLADVLAASIEARTRVFYGISDDPLHKSAKQLW